MHSRVHGRVLFAGDYRPLENAPDGCFACLSYLREGPDGGYLVALNFGDEERVLDIPGRTKGSMAVSTFMDRENREEGTLVLRSGEGCVVELDNQHDTENAENGDYQ